MNPRFHGVAVGAVFLLFGAADARAQGPAPTQAAPDPTKMEEARRHFERGLQLLRDPEGELVEAAYLEFKTAYELSASPRVLGNIGYCAMKMERNSESVAAYREYVRLVPDIDPTERAQIAQDLVTMTEGAARVSVRFAGRGDWTLVDQRVPVRAQQVTNTYTETGSSTLTLLVHPGHHLMRVKIQSEEQSAWEFDATGGAAFEHVFEVKALAPAVRAVAADVVSAKPSSKAPQWATIGVGGAALAASAVTGIAAFLKMKDIEKECPGNICPNASYRSDVNTAQTLGTATDTLLVVGGVLVVGGAVWLGLSGGGKENAQRAPSIGAVCVPGACAGTVGGVF